MSRFVGTKVEFGADIDEFALNIETRALPVIHADNYLNDLLLKYCEAALAGRKENRASCVQDLRTRFRRCFLMEEWSLERLLAPWA